MKKVFIFILLVTVVATVFSGVIQDIRASEPAANSGTVLLLDQLTPVIAYADSDTVDWGGEELSPPPPIH